MQVWERAMADIIYYDDTPATVHDKGYIVRLSDDFIEVCYDDEDGAVCYKGINHGTGHFELKAPERNGSATLHCFPNSHVLEGFWQEGQTKGMWRIWLA